MTLIDFGVGKRPRQTQMKMVENIKRISAAEPQPKTHHGGTETLRNMEKITTLPTMREEWDSPEC